MQFGLVWPWSGGAFGGGLSASAQFNIPFAEGGTAQFGRWDGRAYGPTSSTHGRDYIVSRDKNWDEILSDDESRILVNKICLVHPLVLKLFYLCIIHRHRV